MSVIDEPLKFAEDFTAGTTETYNASLAAEQSEFKLYNVPTFYPDLSHYKSDMVCIWVLIIPCKIKSQNIFMRSISETTFTTEPDYKNTFNFLMPNSFNETFQHTWSAYESPLSNLTDIAKKGADGLAAGQGLVGIAKSIVESKGIDTSTAKTLGSSSSKLLVDAFKSGLASAKVNDFGTYFKMDTVLIYKDSERRRFDLQFDLGDSSGYYSPYIDVVYPVRALNYFASPSTGGMVSSIYNKPYCFSIQTYLMNSGTMQPLPGLIDFKFAALTNIAPTYNGPYRNGYPTNGKVTLSFVDIEPLFKENLVSDSRLVTVSSSNVSTCTKNTNDITVNIK